MSLPTGPELTDPDATYTYVCGECGQIMTATIPQMSAHRADHLDQR